MSVLWVVAARPTAERLRAVAAPVVVGSDACVGLLRSAKLVVVVAAASSAAWGRRDGGVGAGVATTVSGVTSTGAERAVGGASR